MHDFKNQERYYAKIVERYMKFCASSGGSEGLETAFASLHITDSNNSHQASNTSIPNPKPSTSDSRPPLARRASDPERPSNNLPNILLAMRKLREATLGARRRDAFAQRAYIFIVHAAVLARAWEAYVPALLYLLEQIHPHTPLSHPELQEFAGYRVLDLACRQYELGEALSVRAAHGLRSRRVDAVVDAVVRDDWVRFWRERRAVDGYQRAIMEFYVQRMREHALKCIGRSYMSVDRSFVERSAGSTWEELVQGGVGWQLQDGGTVIVRKPKAKA